MMSTIVLGDEESARNLIADLSLAPHHGYRVDGVTKAVEFDHDPDAGTREAGTRYGD